MDIYDIGFWLITWMMLGLLGFQLVGGWYWTYISLVSAILFIGYFTYLIFIRNKKQKKEVNKMNKFSKILIIIMVLLILSSIFMSNNIFYSVGSIGGIVFLIKLLLELGFPNIFKDQEKKK